MNDNLRAARGILTAIGISLAFWGALLVFALWSYECKAADDWSGTSQALGTVALGSYPSRLVTDTLYRTS